MWALAGVAVGFGFAWVLFTAFGQDSDDFSSRFTTFGQNGEELPPLYDEKIVRTVFDTASPSIVEVKTVVQFGRRIGEGSGSGFFVDDQGHIITSDHVVEGAREITVRLNDGRELSAVKLGHSQHDDLALLRVDPAAVADIRPLPFADSDQVSIGEMAIAIGSPYENYNSLSLGIVSGKERSESGIQRVDSYTGGIRRTITDLIQTDAALNPGNSGGPLLNAEGEVIGVNSSVRVQSGVQRGVGFAVASNTVMQILDELMEPGEFTRPWIGLNGFDVEDLQVEPGRLGVDSGVYVVKTCEGGPAELAGVKDDYLAVIMTRGREISGRGDVVTGLNGKPVETWPDLLSSINDFEVGDRVTLDLVRNGDPIQIDITLAKWQDDCE
jgi:S1-C subfamily serine protease